ncbi:9528_t:CDS:2, partial [Funneliformis geosporum]
RENNGDKEMEIIKIIFELKLEIAKLTKNHKVTDLVPKDYQEKLMNMKSIAEAKSYQQEIEKKIQEEKAKHQSLFTDENKLSLPVKVVIGAGIIGRIHQIKKISKPSQHIHLKAKEIKKYCHHRGVYLISTSLPETPLLTHREALVQNQGEKVKINLGKGTISAEGPLGKSEEMPLPADLEITNQENKLSTKSVNSALAGTYNALISNLIKGVVEGHESVVEVKGVGYKH